MGNKNSEETLNLEAVAQVLDEHVRPVLHADGGDVELERVQDDGAVFLCFRGRCAGCPGQQYTLRSLVEPMLMAKVPGVSKVVPVPWHLSSS